MEYLIRNIIFIFVLSALIFSCKTENKDIINHDSSVLKVDTNVVITKDSALKETVKPTKKQTVIKPDYVPPENGGVNEKWSNNRHKVLTRDSNCYFGKGLQKRHRYRGGRQDL